MNIVKCKTRVCMREMVVQPNPASILY